MKSDLPIIRACFIILLIIAIGLMWLSFKRFAISARPRAHCMRAYSILNDSSPSASDRYVTPDELSKAPEKISKCYHSLVRDSNEIAVKGATDQIILFSESFFLFFIAVAGLSWVKLIKKERSALKTQP